MRSFRRHHPERSDALPSRRSVPGSARAFETAIEEIRSARAGRDRVADLGGSQELYLALIAWLAVGDVQAGGADSVISLFRTLDRLGARPLGPGQVYNETVVMFWIVVARRRIPAGIAATPNERAAAARAFARAYASRDRLIYEFYRSSRVHSWKARSSWVEPDLKPIEALDQPGRGASGGHGMMPHA